jgi:hypothetical protein
VRAGSARAPPFPPPVSYTRARRNGAHPPFAAGSLFGGCIKKLPPAWIDVLLRVINLANSVLLFFACYNAFGMVRAGDVTRSFLATYIGMFGALLAVVRALLRARGGGVWGGEGRGVVTRVIAITHRSLFTPAHASKTASPLPLPV